MLVKRQIKTKEGFIMSKSKLVKANEKMADTVVSDYKKIENEVVGAYKKN